MASEIIIVYQDCPTCGSRKAWGDKTIAFASKAGLPVRKVSFVTREGEQLIWNAVQKGITRLPFITDGKSYAYDIETLLQAQSTPQNDQKPKKTTKTKAKVQK